MTRVNHNLSSVSDDASLTRTVTLQLVAGRCGGGECPTVYETDRGTLVVQGYAFEPAHAGVAIAPGEQMVEIPTELLAEYLSARP
jgi:hypothetical protein